jgi:hypothetical protein
VLEQLKENRVVKMDRWVIDLGTARDNKAYNIYKWKYLHVGDCTGNVTIKLGRPSASALDPEEFDDLEDISHFYYLYITNTAQAGDKLVIYFEEKRRWLW